MDTVLDSTDNVQSRMNNTAIAPTTTSPASMTELKSIIVFTSFPSSARLYVEPEIREGHAATAPCVSWLNARWRLAVVLSWNFSTSDP
jgi:hypothetical protein